MIIQRMDKLEKNKKLEKLKYRAELKV